MIKRNIEKTLYVSFELHISGQTVYIQSFPFPAVEILDIDWERRGHYVKYLMPIYEVKYLNKTGLYKAGYRTWIKEHKLDTTANLFGDDDDDDDEAFMEDLKW